MEGKGNLSYFEVYLQADNVLEPSVMLQTSQLLQVNWPPTFHKIPDPNMFACMQGAEKLLVKNNETRKSLAYTIVREGGLS